MRSKTSLIFRLLMIVCTWSLCLAAQQPTKFDDLEAFLNREMVGPDARRIIKSHLIESGTNAPLDNLVAWAKAGFPDMQDEHGYWKTESISLKLGILQSIRYYYSTSPPDDKSNRYLAMLEELQKDDYISYGLSGMAHQFVDASVLEIKVLELLREKDPELRAKGALMGGPLAKENLSLFDRYKQILKSDDNPHVRITVLSQVLGWRRKDIAYLAFERLLNDSDTAVRELAARGVSTAATRGILTTDDLATILPAMLKTNDPFVRVSIGHTAARLCTDRSLYIRTDKVTDELLYGFINLVRLKGTRAGSALSGSELAQEWLAWWTPLIPDYTGRIRLVQ